jgi:hypothetical protein
MGGRALFYTPLLVALMLFLCGGSHSPALAAEIVAATAKRSADIGSAYDTNQQAFLGQGCLEEKYHLTGSEKASGQLELVTDQDAAANELGFSAGGRARFGVSEYSAEARFFRASKSNDYSVSAVWTSEYTLLSYKLDTNASLTPIGINVQNYDTRWTTTCGDEYVDEIVRGARLFFSIRIDFSSKEVKNEFDANFSIAGPMYSAKAAMKNASEQFSRDSKITVSALQIGGDATKFTALFPNPVDGKGSFVSCTLGDFSKCQEVIEAALKYATDTRNGFPSQLSNKSSPSYVAYRTAAYSAHGIYPKHPPEVQDLVRRYRLDIHSKFENELSTASTIDSLLAVIKAPDVQARVSTEARKNNRNLLTLSRAADVCYAPDVDKCQHLMEGLILEPIDYKALELPRLPEADMRFMDSLGNVIDRARSASFMTEHPGLDKYILALPSYRATTIPLGYEFSKTVKDGMDNNIMLNLHDYFTKPKHDDLSGFQSDYYRYYDDQFALSVAKDASIVMYVSGVALTEAALYFQGTEISKLQLNSNQRKQDGRYSDGAASIVIETVRKKPDWWDFNIDKEVVRLAGQQPDGSGIFAVVVRDGFGRERQFDISYVNWQTEEHQADVFGNGAMQTFRSVYMTKRHRWWDKNSGGTSVKSPGSWSTDATTRIYYDWVRKD